jgi:multidrug efflux pump subunit AcrA (membrane-fusion protein)
LAKKFVKYISIVLFISPIASGIYIYRKRTIMTAAQNQALNFTTVKKGDIKISFASDGESYLPILKLRFQISGQLKEVNVNIGDKVKKGDILAKLDDRDYRNKLDTAQISYDQALTKKVAQKAKRIIHVNDGRVG